MRRELTSSVVTDLESAAEALAARLRQARERLATEARVVADEPRLKAALTTEGIDRATLDDMAGELRHTTHWDLVALLDPAGHILALSGAPSPDGLVTAGRLAHAPLLSTRAPRRCFAPSCSPVVAGISCRRADASHQGTRPRVSLPARSWWPRRSPGAVPCAGAASLAATIAVSPDRRRESWPRSPAERGTSARRCPGSADTGSLRFRCATHLLMRGAFSFARGGCSPRGSVAAVERMHARPSPARGIAEGRGPHDLAHLHVPTRSACRSREFRLANRDGALCSANRAATSWSGWTSPT